MGDGACRPDAALANSVVMSRAFGAFLAIFGVNDGASVGFVINGRLLSPALRDWGASAMGRLV